MNNFLFSTPAQKIWDFLCQNPQESFYSSQVAVRTGLSKGGTNQILRSLAKQGVVEVEKKGRMIFYRVDARSPFIRQFKILRNIALVDSLIKKIKPLAERIILFGSCATGDDTPASDIDLFVLSREEEKIQKLIPEVKDRRKIQLVIKSPQEFLALASKEPVFYGELQKGVVLWEKGS